MSTSKADFWSVEGWISASRRETLTYLAPKSFNTNSGVQLSMETKSARSRVACESSLLLHWIDAIVRPEYSSSRCCVIKSPIQSLEFIPLTYFLTTHGSQTSSPVAVTVWPEMEFFHPLFLSRLEFLKAAFWALFFFWFSSMISPTLWKILYICLPMTPPSAVPSVIPQTGKQQLLRSPQIWIKSQTDPTRGTCLSIRTNLTLSLCLFERTV